MKHLFNWDKLIHPISKKEKKETTVATQIKHDSYDGYDTENLIEEYATPSVKKTNLDVEYSFRFPKNYNIDQVTNYFFGMLMKFYQNKFTDADFDKFETFNKLLLLKNDVNIEKLKKHLVQKIKSTLNTREIANLFHKLETNPKYGWLGWIDLKYSIKSQTGGRGRSRTRRLPGSSKIRSKKHSKKRN